MRYLGKIKGVGVLRSGDDMVGVPADYEFDGFLRKNNQVASCGEIRMSPAALRDAFDRKDLRLLTADGRLLRLSFCEKKLNELSDAAPVDVTGELPEASGWRR